MKTAKFASVWHTDEKNWNIPRAHGNKKQSLGIVKRAGVRKEGKKNKKTLPWNVNSGIKIFICVSS